MTERGRDTTEAMTGDDQQRALTASLSMEQFDDFEVILELGRGAFARVMLARQLSMQRLVALKVSAVAGHEPKTLAQFDHEQIVRVYDQRPLADRGVHLLYMEYLPGGTLQQVIGRVKTTSAAGRTGEVWIAALSDALRRNGETFERDSLAVRELAGVGWAETVCWVGARLAEGLGHAHQKGVLHRDLKPANVLLSRQGNPKLADFNVSYHAAAPGSNPADSFGGSLVYMSPEQLEAFDPDSSRAASDLDARSDIYSLGVVLWELLTGERPFGHEGVQGDRNATVRKLARARREGPREAVVLEATGEWPEGLVAVLLRCLAADRDERWQSADQLSRQLSLCLDAELQSLLRPSPDGWTAWWGRRPVTAVTSAVMIPNILAGAFNLFYNRDTIVSRLGASQLIAFDRIQMTINLIAYPIGLGLAAYLSWTIARAMRRESEEPRMGILPDAPTRIRHRCLRLGQTAALIGLVEWVLAGFAYPIAMSWATDDFPWHAVAHFWSSLLFCGLIAASYPFFAVSCLTVRTQYPRLLGDDPDLGEDRDVLLALRRRMWTFFGLAIAVPFLAIVLLAVTRNDSALALLGLSGVSLVGVYPLLQCLRRLQADLDTLLSLADRRVGRPQEASACRM